jgi:hypothetical protein
LAEEGNNFVFESELEFVRDSNGKSWFDDLLLDELFWLVDLAERGAVLIAPRWFECVVLLTRFSWCPFLCESVSDLFRGLDLALLAERLKFELSRKSFNFF